MKSFLQSNPRGIEDVRHDMGGCDDIDVMAANLLKVKHPVCQVFILDFLSSSLVRNGPVLAEDTAKVAIGEEDGARPFSAHQRHLLSKMRVIAENHRFDRSSTESPFTLLPIHATLPWTESTIFEEGISLFDPLSQFPLYLQFFEGWNPLTLLLF
jgi:hypothetical protein